MDEDVNTSPLKFEDKWVRIQENTFRNWVNEQLSEAESHIEDLRGAFTDGVKLCSLIAALQGQQKINGMRPNPKNQHEKFENVTLALQAAKADKTKLVNIGPTDIVNDNHKLVLGLIWSLILRYQIGKSKVPPKQLMLAWINAVIPGCNVKNFTTDWNDGRALFALIDYCEPGLAPNWRTLNTSDRVANCEAAMQLAQERLGVPMVVSPTHMASTDLDQFSGMTYLSYFMKLNSCGYKATLKNINKLIVPRTVQNFVSDWRDGATLGTLVQAVGGHVSGWPDLPVFDPVHCTKLGISAANEIGVKPLLSAEEMVNPQDGHLPIMAYAANFVHRTAVKLPSSSLLEIMFNTVDITVGTRTQYNLLMKHGDPRLHDIQVSITDSLNRPVPTSFDWLDDEPGQAKGILIPTTAGQHKLIVSCDGQIIRSCPIIFNVAGGKRFLSVLKKDTAVVGKVTKLEVAADGATPGDIKLTCISPSGVRKEIPLVRNLASSSSELARLMHDFIPDVIGRWVVEVTSNGEHANGSPFLINAIRPEEVKVHDLTGGVIGEEFSFQVDATRAGEAELQCVIDQSGRILKCHVQPLSPGTYRINFSPEAAGIYNIRLIYGGLDVSEQPKTVEILNTNMVTASGDGLKRARVGTVAYFDVSARGAGSHSELKAQIYDPAGKTLNADIRYLPASESYHVQYTPKVTGNHEVELTFAGKEVKDSPFTVNVFNPELCVAKVPSKGLLHKPVTMEISAHQAGLGDIEINVNEGLVPCTVEQAENKSYRAVFIPTEPGQYIVEMNFNSIPIKGSPWFVNVSASDLTDSSHFNGFGATSKSIQVAPIGELRSFEVSVNKDVAVKIIGPTGRQVPYKTTPTAKGGLNVEYTFTEIGDHEIHIVAAGKAVHGSPFLVRVYDPRSDRGTVLDSPIAPIVVVNLTKTARVLETTHFDLHSSNLQQDDVKVVLTGPSGELVPTALHQDTSKEMRVEYRTAKVGRHKIDIYYKGQKLADSPYTVDVFDPHLVTVEQFTTDSIVNEGTDFEVITAGTGTSEVDIRVIGPSGQVIANSQQMTARGKKVSYTPMDPGIYSIHISAGGVPIHGSPLNQVVRERGPRRVVVSGPGLQHAEEDKMAVFYIEADEPSGPPHVNVEGPNSLAKCNISAEGQHRYKVIYVPVETGIYNVHVKYNGEELAGSPFHPRVTNARKVKALSVLNLDEHQRAKVAVGEVKKILLDVTEAGPGELQASVRTTKDQPVAVAIIPKDQFHYSVEFALERLGEHILNVSWSGTPVSTLPDRLIAVDGTVQATKGKLILVGPGLKQGIAGHTCEFHIDSSLANEGVPKVVLQNSRLQEISVGLVRLGPTEYRCSYVVQESGTYMLHISWAGQSVEHSPYTVIIKDDTYNPSTMSSQITMNGHIQQDISQNGRAKLSLKDSNRTQSYVGESLLFTIDAESVKPGKAMSAECIGPTQRPLCDLQALERGVYSLRVNLEEPGQHQLHIKCDGEHIDGSPYQFIVLPEEFTANVWVRGPGIEHGILAKFEGMFVIYSEGPSLDGRLLNIKIRGPKGACPYKQLRVNAHKITVTFEPTDVGLYVITVKHSGHAVQRGGDNPKQQEQKSPFHVRIFDTYEELNRFMHDGQDIRPNGVPLANLYPSFKTKLPRSASYHSNSTANVLQGDQYRNPSMVFRASSLPTKIVLNGASRNGMYYKPGQGRPRHQRANGVRAGQIGVKPYRSSFVVHKNGPQIQLSAGSYNEP